MGRTEPVSPSEAAGFIPPHVWIDFGIRMEFIKAGFLELNSPQAITRGYHWGFQGLSRAG